MSSGRLNAVHAVVDEREILELAPWSVDAGGSNRALAALQSGRGRIGGGTILCKPVLMWSYTIREHRL